MKLVVTVIPSPPSEPPTPDLVVITTAPFAAPEPERAAAAGPVGIQVLDRVAVVDSSVPRVVLVRVVDGDTIEDEEWLVVARDGAGAADDDPGGAPCGPGVGDVDARHVALERVDEIDLRHLGNLRTLNVLYRVTQ